MRREKISSAGRSGSPSPCQISIRSCAEPRGASSFAQPLSYGHPVHAEVLCEFHLGLTFGVGFNSDFSDMGIWNFLFNLSFSYVI